MKKAIVIILLMCACYLRAQVFTGTGGPVLNNGQHTYFGLVVTGLTHPLDSTFGVEQVCINLDHPNVSEIYLYLQSPAGKRVNLVLGSSASGTSFVNTCFNSLAPASVTLAQSPYTGTFKPVGYLGRFNTEVNGNGTWHLVVHDAFSNNHTGKLVSWSIQFGAATCSPVTCHSSNLPVVLIKTTQPVSDVKTNGQMSIIHNGKKRNTFWPKSLKQIPIDIQLHGSSTRLYEKKPFHIGTRDPAGKKQNIPLLGLPAESDWLLIASYLDKSLLRIPFTYDIFRLMGHYAARYKPVELMLNDEYQGVYLLMEKLKRDPNRINIQKLERHDTLYPAISGGYIFKIDRTDAAGWYSEVPGHSATGARFYYNFVYPTKSNITVTQQKYLEHFVDSFELAMNAPYFADPAQGYRKFIDVKSFIDFFIINELSRNIDAYRLSTYLYKENDSKGGKLHIGPVWDYDLAWHNCKFADASNPQGWQYTLQHDQYPSPTWWVRLMEDPAFVQELKERWAHLRSHLLDLHKLTHYIDSSAAVLKEAAQRNYTQFPTLGASIYGNPQDQLQASYAAEVNDIKVWLAARITWMDQQLGANNTDPLPEEDAYSLQPINETTLPFEMPADQEGSFSIATKPRKSAGRSSYMVNLLPANCAVIQSKTNRHNH